MTGLVDETRAAMKRRPWAAFVPNGTLEGGSARAFATRYALIGILLLLIALFSVLLPGFFSYANFRSLLGAQSLLVLLAIGAMLPLALGQMDISAPAILSLSSVAVAALTTRFGLPTPIAILLALSISVLVGGINAFFVVRVGINSIITTLGMWTVIDGALAGYLGARLVTGDFPAPLMAIGQASILGMPVPAILAGVVVLVAWYAMQHTPFGRHVYAIGQSQQAARLAGIHVRRLTAISFLLSSLLAGMAGVVAMAQFGVGNPKVGEPLLFPAFIAVFLGAAAIKVGTFNVTGTIVGIFVVATTVSGLRLAGISSWVSYLVHGGGLIVALVLVRYLNREPV